MSDDRLFHKKAGHSDKVNRLTADEEIVWRTYVNAADDFGVMRFEALPIQEAHDRFAGRSARVVMRMLEAVATVGLISVFEHQGRPYCYQADWQDFQKIRYPQKTVHPQIPDWLLAACTVNTRWLHTLWPGTGKKLAKWKAPEDWVDLREYSRNPSGNDSGIDSGNDSRPRARAALSLSLSLSRTQTRPIEAARKIRAAEDDETLGTGKFVRRFCELYRQHCGASYHVTPSKHIPLIRGLLRTHGGPQLERLAVVMLTATADDWLNETDRGIEILHTKINWLASRLAAYEREHGPIGAAS